MNCIRRPVLKTGYFWKRKDYRRVTLHRLISGLEVLSPLVTGSPDVIRKLSGNARASWEVPSVLFDPGTDLYGLCVWRYNLRYKADFFQIHFCWWRRIYSLSLTPFSETYELRGYVVEVYQRYIPNLVTWHTECCCEMISVWSFVIWSFVWSYIFVIIGWSFCLTRSRAFCRKRSFVDETSSSLTPRKWSKQEGCSKVLGSSAP